MKTIDDIRWIINLCCAAYNFSMFEECPFPPTCCHMHALAIHMILRGEY